MIPKTPEHSGWSDPFDDARRRQDRPPHDPADDPAEAGYDDVERASRPFRDGEGEDLEAEILRLRVERDEALAARQRALADFANYQRRADESERRAFQNGAAKVVRSLIPPLDHLDLALGQDPASMKLDQLLAGVRMVQDELGRALDASGVSRFSPARGDEFDPQRHEAMLRQPAPDLPPNAIVQSVQPGYAMGDYVLRPAKVIVSGE